MIFLLRKEKSRIVCLTGPYPLLSLLYTSTTINFIHIATSILLYISLFWLVTVTYFLAKSFFLLNRFKKKSYVLNMFCWWPTYSQITLLNKPSLGVFLSRVIAPFYYYIFSILDNSCMCYICDWNKLIF